MNWIVTFYSALLFFVLVPGVLVSFPPKRGKYVVAGFHALVFALIWHFTNKMVWHASTNHEGFSEGAKNKSNDKKKTKPKSNGNASVKGASVKP